jgi:hypothetical protein
MRLSTLGIVSWPGMGSWSRTCIAALALSACGPSAKPPVAPTAPADFEPTGQRSELCSAINVVGVGLQGEYFAQPQWKGAPALTRVDASIDFIDSLELPPELAGHAPESVRWTGWVKAPTNGRYRFHVRPANARVLVSRTDMRAGAPESEGIELVAGHFYPITVEIDRLEGGKPVKLEWTAPHGARYVIPRALLNLPTETVAAPASR